MHIISVVGARPQFVKLFPLHKAILKYGLKHTIIHTGQHYDFNMSDLFFKELNLPKPDINLEVGSNSFGVQLSEMLKSLEHILPEIQPDLILNYGDTNTTLATALVSARLGFKQAHIEAGLRSGIFTMPEEQNRIIADSLSSILFVPTPTGINNLSKEGIRKNVYLVGDVMVDSLKIMLPYAMEKSTIIDRLNLTPHTYSILTIHRAENTENPETFVNIFNAIKMIGEPIIFPVHPRSLERLNKWGLMDSIPNNLRMIEPLGYIDMLIIQKFAKVILTDSGGMQKEALLLDRPCVTLRETTEWIETIESGANILVGTDTEKIVDGFNTMKNKGKFIIPECFKLNAVNLIMDKIKELFADMI